MRVIYSRADVRKIAEYRENLNSALQSFEVGHKPNVSSDAKYDEEIPDEWKQKIAYQPTSVRYIDLSQIIPSL